MGDKGPCERRTADEIAEGFPFSKRFHTHGDTPKSQLLPTGIKTEAKALQQRLYNEELFLVRLLSYQRTDHRRIKEALVDRVEWLLQRIPIDLLSYQWLQNCTISSEVRAFLVEHLLPTVILGLEYILREADSRGLCKIHKNDTSGEDEIDVHMDVNFNPINRLAEFLMRNNPRYPNLTGNICLSPYTRGMRQILDLLKQDLFLKSDTELARYTAAAEKRKSDLNEAQDRVERELDEKRRRMEPVFDCFRVGDKDTVNAVIVQKSIRSFLTVVMGMPEDLAKIERPIVHIENVDENIEDYTRSEFMSYAMAYVRPLSMEAFQALTDHLQRCGREYREQVDLRIKLDTVAEVAISCDKGAVENVDRKKLFKAFDKFAMESNEEVQKNLVFPNEWRIHEYHLRHAKFDPWDKSVQILPYRPSERFKDAKPVREPTPPPPSPSPSPPPPPPPPIPTPPKEAEEEEGEAGNTEAPENPDNS